MEEKSDQSSNNFHWLMFHWSTMYNLRKTAKFHFGNSKLYLRGTALALVYIFCLVLLFYLIMMYLTRIFVVIGKCVIGT